MFQLVAEEEQIDENLRETRFGVRRVEGAVFLPET